MVMFEKLFLGRRGVELHRLAGSKGSRYGFPGWEHRLALGGYPWSF